MAPSARVRSAPDSGSGASPQTAQNLGLDRGRLGLGGGGLQAGEQAVQPRIALLGGPEVRQEAEEDRRERRGRARHGAQPLDGAGAGTAGAIALARSSSAWLIAATMAG